MNKVEQRNLMLVDFFYDDLIRKIALGKEKFHINYFVRFNTVIVEDDLKFIGEDESKYLVIPTLIIRDKNKFNKLLLEYIDLASSFYDVDDFLFYDRVNISDFDLYGKKIIMIMLWANATFEDFINPCVFLEKRIAFFKLGVFEKYIDGKILGYSDNLKSDIKVKVIKGGLESETPYVLKSYLLNPNTGTRVYDLPDIRFGIYNNTGYVYTIQNYKYRFISYDDKKYYRLTYKVNKGFDVTENTYDNYGVANLKDISPNFLVVANILMGLFRENNISRVVIPSFLIGRWNDKGRVLEKYLEKLNKMELSLEKKEELIKEYEESCYYLQSNLTDKFLRVFRRCCYHHSSINVRAYPFDIDSNLELEILDGEDVCNNELLSETYEFSTNKNQKIKKKNI